MSVDTIDVMVHLIGEQVMPNLLAAFQFRPKYNILIHTERTLYVARRLQKSLEDRKLHAELRQVVSNDYIDMVRLVSRIAEDYRGKTIWFNITGGTKIMSFVSLISAIKDDRIFLYYNYVTQQFLLFTPRRDDYPILTTRKLNVRLDIPTILTAHGYNLVEFRRSEPEAERKLAEFIGRNAYRLLDRCNLGGWSGNFLQMVLRNYPKICSESVKGIVETIREMVGEIKPPVNNFLQGLWLEHYVFQQLSPLMDQAFYNVKIVSEGGVSNEIDFLGVRKNRLYVVSCKVVRKKATSVYKDHIAELDVLSKLMGGTFARKALVTATRIGRGSATRRRAHEYDIRVFDISTFRNLRRQFARAFNLRN